MGKVSAEKKDAYVRRMESYFKDYSSIFVINIDNVRSNQFHNVRKELRGFGEILMGKNTFLKYFLSNHIEDTNDRDLEKLVKELVGNIGLVFTNSDLREVRERITSNRIRAPAKSGIVSPLDVIVPAGNTGMEPSKTSFFQALGIPTKIAKGTIEIVSDVELLKKNDKVGLSEATLLNILNISPFTYGFGISAIYDKGSLFSPDILDIDQEAVTKGLEKALQNITGLSLGAAYPTKLSVFHIAAHAVKSLLALGIGYRSASDPEASSEPCGKFEGLLREKFSV